MNQYDLKILRNEIYARHGLLFTNEEMKQYFNLQDWYKPQYAEVNTYLTE
ncbi:MAG: YARHG domain-containing protein [Bacteroidota bacterium]